jgi:hypothetical protein
VQQAAASGLSLDAYLQRLLGLRNGQPEDLSLAAETAQPAAVESLAAFRADLEALAEGTEHLPATPITYSRADIYFDHD